MLLTNNAGKAMRLLKALKLAPFVFPSTDGGEMTNRWDMQETPPDILITNVSMLSAMLNREVEQPIFDKTRTWLTENDDAYFYLILDALHVDRLLGILS